MFAVALVAGKKAGSRRPATIIRAGFIGLTVGLVILLPIGPPRDVRTGPGAAPDDRRLRIGSAGLAVEQLQLSPISEERVSEATGVNSAAGSFGLSFGLAFAGAIMVASLSVAFMDMSDNSACSPRPSSSRSPPRSRTTPSW